MVPGQSNNGCLCTREARTREPRRPELALKTQKCPPLETVVLGTCERPNMLESDIYGGEQK